MLRFSFVLLSFTEMLKLNKSALKHVIFGVVVVCGCSVHPLLFQYGIYSWIGIEIGILGRI